MKRLKGSFTIEISILLPLLFFLFMLVLKEGIGFYQYSKQREVSNLVTETDLVRKFYNYQILGEVGEELLDEEP